MGSGKREQAPTRQQRATLGNKGNKGTAGAIYNGTRARDDTLKRRRSPAQPGRQSVATNTPENSAPGRQNEPGQGKVGDNNTPPHRKKQKMKRNIQDATAAAILGTLTGLLAAIIAILAGFTASIISQLLGGPYLLATISPDTIGGILVGIGAVVAVNATRKHWKEFKAIRRR